METTDHWFCNTGGHSSATLTKLDINTGQLLNAINLCHTQAWQRMALELLNQPSMYAVALTKWVVSPRLLLGGVGIRSCGGAGFVDVAAVGRSRYSGTAVRIRIILIGSTLARRPKFPPWIIQVIYVHLGQGRDGTVSYELCYPNRTSIDYSEIDPSTSTVHLGNQVTFAKSIKGP